MKIRNGFVSNSSSSSFVIIGKRLSAKEADEKLSSGNSITVRGKTLSDGYDVFTLIPEMRMLIPKSSVYFLHDQYGMEFFETYLKIDTDMNLEISRDSLPEKFGVFSFEIDYHSTESVDDFKNRYLDEEDWY